MDLLKQSEDVNMKKIPINIFLNETEILECMHSNHYNKKDKASIMQVYYNLLSAMSSGIYVRHIKKETSRRLSFIMDEEYVLVLATLGKGVDLLHGQYHRMEEIWKEYAAECLTMELLRKLYEKIEIEIFKLSGKFPMKYNFVGDDGNMQDIKEVLSYFKQNEIIYNDAFALLPRKTVVFTSGLQEHRGFSTCLICIDCKNLSCKERR